MVPQSILFTAPYREPPQAPKKPTNKKPLWRRILCAVGWHRYEVEKWPRTRLGQLLFVSMGYPRVNLEDQSPVHYMMGAQAVMHSCRSCHQIHLEVVWRPPS